MKPPKITLNPATFVKDLKTFNPEGMISVKPSSAPLKPQTLDEFMFQTPIEDFEDFKNEMRFDSN